MSTSKFVSDLLTKKKTNGNQTKAPPPSTKEQLLFRSMVQQLVRESRQPPPVLQILDESLSLSGVHPHDGCSSDDNSVGSDTSKYYDALSCVNDSGAAVPKTVYSSSSTNHSEPNPHCPNHEFERHVQDGTMVGTPAILESSNAYYPERVNQPVPVPSVYRDDRGEIHNCQFGKVRVNVLLTKQGVWRSGDIHSTTQCDFILAGAVKVHTLQPNGTTLVCFYGPNEYIEIPKYTPHLFEFVQDTTMLEWWHGPFQAWFYRPYRTIVEQSNATIGGGQLVSSMGNECSLSPISSLWKVVDRLSKPQLFCSGLAVGLSTGWLLLRKRR